MNFIPRGQACQDLLVYEVIVKPEGKFNGTFLDVGCCHPTELSNTYALEQLGWRGLLVDIDPGAVELCHSKRFSPVIQADATKLNFDSAIREAWKSFNAVFGCVILAKGWALPACIDYLSMDVDSATLASLQNLMTADVRFRVITIEHDSYRFGPGPRSAMRQILFQRGYDLVCEDVCSADGQPYEDWWVSPELSERADRFRCRGKKWTEIFKP